MRQFFLVVAPYLIFLVFITSTSFAKKEPVLSQMDIQKFLPEALRVREDGKPNTLNGDINVEQVSARFEKNSKNKHFVLAYRLNRNEEPCYLVTLKKMENTVLIDPAPILNSYTKLSGCAGLRAEDLDQNGIDEIIVTRTNGRAVLAPAIFRWDIKKLVDVTPAKPGSPSESALSDITVLSEPVRKKLVIFDSDQENFPGSKVKEYSYGKDKLNLVGEYDAVFYIDKTPSGKAVTVKPELEERTYSLVVSNVSDHDRAVSAEVSVDGSTVLKSQDFCEKAQPKKSDRIAWRGNDDEDDLDEDHCKRCSPKSETYAIVNLKPTSEIKIQVYGKKSSEIKLTINRKD